jgi:hypothetical protein
MPTDRYGDWAYAAPAMTMRFPLFAAAASSIFFAAGPVAAGPGARCELKGSFNGAAVPGAVASGKVSAGSQLALDLFGPNPTHKLLITLTPTATGASLAVSLSDVKAESDLFLETTLGTTVLSLAVRGAFEDRKVDDVSLLCVSTP